MPRTKGAKNKATLALVEKAKAAAPGTLAHIAKAIGRTEAQAYGFLYGQHLLYLVTDIGHKARSVETTRLAKPAAAQAHDTPTMPPDIDEDALRRALIAGIEPARLHWLLSCPRGGNAHGWRGGSAIG